MTDEELMQQALEALEAGSTAWAVMNVGGIKDALRKRLAQPEQEPFCFHDGRNIVGKEYADHSDVFPLYTSPNPEQQKPVRFKCTVVDDAHPNGVPLSQWGKQHEMQPCAGRNCGSTNPNLHSAECFEDYDKATGADSNRTWTQAHWTEYEHSIAAAEREAIAQSLDKQADLAPDEIDRQWAQEMAAAVRARGEKT